MGITSTVATAITWLLYGALSLIVFGAIGYAFWMAKKYIDSWKKNKAMTQKIEQEHKAQLNDLPQFENDRDTNEYQR